MSETYWDKQERFKEMLAKIQGRRSKAYFDKLKKLAEDSGEKWEEPEFGKLGPIWDDEDDL